MADLEKRTLPVVGMMCAGCSAAVEKRLNATKGVETAAVNLAARTVTVDYNPAAVTLQQMKDELAAIGYDLVIENDRDMVAEERRARRRLALRVIVAWVASLVVMALAMGWLSVGRVDDNNFTAMLVTVATMLYCGRTFYINMWKQLRHGSAGMDTLVGLSTLASFGLSVFNTFWGEAYWTPRQVEWHTYYEATTMIIAFVLTGRWLEERAKNSAAGAIRSLMGLAPQEARLVDGAATTLVPVATLQPGDVVQVEAGDRVPVDGMVLAGDGAVDESMVTGEPVAVARKRGDKVVAGTIVRRGTLRVRAQQVGSSTMLARIVDMVKQAQGSKAPVQRVVDRVAAVFVPAVIVVAAVTLVVWLLVGGSEQWPQAVMRAVSTLVVACPCALGLATPTALMVGMGKAAKQNVLIKDATALEALHAVDTLVMDKTGTMTIPHVDLNPNDDLSLDDRESIAPGAREMVQSLKEMGVELWLASGDREEAVAHCAGLTGVEHWRSALLPQGKEDLVRRLREQGRRVAMVGDGINDSQALAAATVSIAMGGGTDVAMDAAQVTLMGGRLELIPQAINLSRRTVRMIRQNLFWAFIYNVVCLPLAAGVIPSITITPMLAAALMACSSLSVVLNTLRLARRD